MTDESLSFLVDWFDRNCDGDWEHDTGVRINTLDNPGWTVKVRLIGTELEGAVVELVKHDEGESWLHWRSTGAQFEAACGPRDLRRALVALRTRRGFWRTIRPE